jgi:hypothetical protein
LGCNIRWPTGERLRKVTIEFQQKQGLPNCIGTVDGTHIEIRTPGDSKLATNCRNRKGDYLVLLQGVVDSRCCFTSIHIGVCGLIHDVGHIRLTGLYRDAVEGRIFGFNMVNPEILPASVHFPPYILEDKAYPQLPWLMTPMKLDPRHELQDKESMYNHKHSSTHMIVERSFGILKGCFHEFDYKTKLRWDFIPAVITACCILHNVLVMSKDRSINEMLRDLDLDENGLSFDSRRQRVQQDVANRHIPQLVFGGDDETIEGCHARSDLIKYLAVLSDPTKYMAVVREQRQQQRRV